MIALPMATISVPTPTGGRRELRLREGISLEGALRQQHVHEAAHRYGVERKTPVGWVLTTTGYVLQIGDVLRVRPSPTASTNKADPLVQWVSHLLSSVEKKRR
jgi:hypothetical protein